MSQEKLDIKKKKCRTPEFRASFPHLIEKHSGFEGQKPKYSLTMLIPKNVNLAQNFSKEGEGVSMREAAYNALWEAWPKLKTALGIKAKWPVGFRSPFRDADVDKVNPETGKVELEGYANHWFVSASSVKRKPQVIGTQKDENGQWIELTEEGEFYAGCYGRATLIAFAYDTAGNKGVSFSLQNVKKTREGTEFSGRRNAHDDFSDVEEVDGSENPDNYSGSGDTTEDESTGDSNFGF